MLRLFSSRFLLYAGMALMFLGSALLFLLHVTGFVTVTTVIIASFIYFLSFNLSMPNAYTLAYRHVTEHRGVATALLGFIQMFTLMLVSFIISLLPEDNVLSIAFMFGLSGLLVLYIMRLTAGEGEV